MHGEEESTINGNGKNTVLVEGGVRFPYRCRCRHTGTGIYHIPACQTTTTIYSTTKSLSLQLYHPPTHRPHHIIPFLAQSCCYCCYYGSCSSLLVGLDWGHPFVVFLFLLFLVALPLPPPRWSCLLHCHCCCGVYPLRYLLLLLFVGAGACRAVLDTYTFDDSFVWILFATATEEDDSLFLLLAVLSFLAVDRSCSFLCTWFFLSLFSHRVHLVDSEVVSSRKEKKGGIGAVLSNDGDRCQSTVGVVAKAVVATLLFATSLLPPATTTFTGVCVCLSTSLFSSIVVPRDMFTQKVYSLVTYCWFVLIALLLLWRLLTYRN